jgi:hypothetical protein
MGTHYGSLEDVDWSAYGFIDLGASSGGSLRFCELRFGLGPGIGVDIDPGKVARAAERDFDVVQADATRLELDDVVSFVSMMDFCEHLPGLDVVEAILASAARAARDFIYIHHPSFEAEHYLVAHGVRQYWHDWSGHGAHVRVSDYCQMFDRLGLHQYMVRYSEPVMDSQHPSILPLSAARNQHEYDPEVHDEKPDIRFEDRPWRSQDIFIALRRFEPEEWQRITNAGKGQA